MARAVDRVLAAYLVRVSGLPSPYTPKECSLDWLVPHHTTSLSYSTQTLAVRCDAVQMPLLDAGQACAIQSSLLFPGPVEVALFKVACARAVIHDVYGVRSTLHCALYSV